MATKDKGLSKEAQNWDDLIRDVHKAEQGEADKVVAHGNRIADAIKRVMWSTGGKIVIAAFVLLMMLFALAFIPDWGTGSNTTSGGGDEAVPALDENTATPADGIEAAPVPGAADAAVVEDEVLLPGAIDEAGDDTPVIVDQSAGDANEPAPGAIDGVTDSDAPVAVPGQAPEVITPPLDPTAVLLESAVGTYRISEPSARAATEVRWERLESAVGLLDVHADGTVSGTFTFVYWAVFQGLTGDPVVRATSDITLLPAELGLAGDSTLGFEGTVEWNQVTELPNGPQNNATSLPVMGLLEPDRGVLELFLSGDQTGLEFLRD